MSLVDRVENLEKVVDTLCGLNAQVQTMESEIFLLRTELTEIKEEMEEKKKKAGLFFGKRMSETDFALTSEDTRKLRQSVRAARLFHRPSKAMRCRQLIYSTCKAIDGSMVLADFVRDHKDEFRSAEIYRAARTLVTHGILTREDISWAVLEKGSERTRYRCAIRFIEPFTEASRVW